MPPGGQEQKRSLSDAQLQKCGIAFIKASQHFDVGKAVRLDPAMFPKVDFGKVIEARIIERREQRAFKIDLLQHSVARIIRLIHADRANAQNFRQELRPLN